MIELQLSVMPYVVIENLTKRPKWISWFDLINTIILFELIGSIIWSNLIKSYLLIQFNYFDSTVICKRV